MKSTILFILSLANTIAFAQKISDTLEVPFDKSAILIFSDSITNHDVGVDSTKYMYQEKGNMCKLASARRSGPESSLYIQTADGYYYYFILKYNNLPKRPIIGVDVSKSVGRIKQKGRDFQESLPQQIRIDTNHASFEKICQNIVLRPANIGNIGVLQKRILFYLESIYVKGDKIYYQISTENQSNIYYDIDFESFSVKSSKGKIKDAVVQDSKIQPLYVYNGNIKRVNGKSKITKVFVFDKFTIGNKKHIYVELWEKGGERNVSFKIRPKDILKAQLL